jgi:YesN/AraC family two-component response regulator
LNSRNEKYGSGIGLSYSKILVEMHKGKIGAYNNAEKGACFWYELPIHPQLSEVCPPREYLNILTTASENDECTPIQNPIDTKNYSCLFVDDNENIRQMIIETLKDSFKNLYIASNGKEALQIILKEIPDIVISDIMMPEMNGYELCRKIKEDMNINHIQVILLTARTDEQSHLDGYKTGADAYMEKPFEINSLLENVRNRLYLREQIKLKYTHSVISDTEKPATSADDTFIFKLNKVIIENMENEGLNVDLISQELGISRASLYNRLKALTGMGANEYVNKLRIEKAMELLRQTELNMTEIAEHTGFSTSRYFSTAFKKYTGITPTQYKENPDTLNNRPDK